MKKDNEWGFYTLPTQTDPEKRAGRYYQRR